MRKIKPFFSYFPGFSESEVLSKCIYFHDDEIILLQKKFGKDYKNTHSTIALTKEENARIFSVLIPSLNKWLKNPDKIRRNRSLSSKVKTINMKKIIPFRELIPEISEKNLTEILKNLSLSEMNLLKKRFGIMLQNKFELEPITAREYKIIYSDIIPKVSTWISKSDYLATPIETKEVDKEVMPSIEKIVPDIITTSNSKDEIENLKTIKPLKLVLNNIEADDFSKIVALLTEEEKNLIQKRFGKDYNAEFETEKLTDEEYKKIYSILIPKMKRWIDKNKQVTVIEEETFKPVEQSKPVYEEKPDNLEFSSSGLNNLSVSELVILSCINGIEFSTETIAKLYNINEEEVINLKRKTLLLFKNNLNQMIDNVINGYEVEVRKRVIDSKDKE